MFEPAVRRTFEELYTEVLTGLTDGHLRPADRISVKDLSIALKVSTTPLREILSRLVGRGVVEERRSEGYYLARLDARDIIDLYRFHEFCVFRTVVTAAVAQVAQTEYATAYDLFDALARAAEDAIVTEVRRFLDDRLKVLRRAEAIAIPDFVREAKDIAGAIRAHDLDGLRAKIGAFHTRRCDAAAEIALLISRGSMRG